MRFYREIPDQIVEAVEIEDIERTLDALRYIKEGVHETKENAPLCHCPYIKWIKPDGKVLIPYDRKLRDIYSPAEKLADWIYRVQEVIRDVSYNEGLDEVCIWDMVKNGVYRDNKGLLKVCWTQEDREEMRRLDVMKMTQLKMLESDMKMIVEMSISQKRVQELPPHDYSNKKVKE